MSSYTKQILNAMRWDRCVDYGSVMSAWTPEMFTILDECGGDKMKATEVLQERRAAQRNSGAENDKG